MIDNEQKRILAAMILSGIAGNHDGTDLLDGSVQKRVVESAVDLVNLLCAALPDPPAQTLDGP